MTLARLSTILSSIAPLAGATEEDQATVDHNQLSARYLTRHIGVLGVFSEIDFH